MRIILLAFCSVVLAGCKVSPATFKDGSCGSKTTFTELDVSPTSYGLSAGAAIGQHIIMNETMTVKRVMIKATSPGVTNIIISFFSNFSSADQMTFSGPVYSFTWISSFSAVQFTTMWFDLPQPFKMMGGVSYLIGFAPNSNMTLAASGASFEHSEIRGDYRPGSGPYSWGNATQGAALSIGLEGDLGCQ